MAAARDVLLWRGALAGLGQCGESVGQTEITAVVHGGVQPVSCTRPLVEAFSVRL
jgi:hypothetical protein